MADIALVNANRVSVVESIEQHTAPANVNIVAGQVVALNPTNGRWILATDDRAYGVATKTVRAGEACTAIKQGVMDGFELGALDWDDDLFLNAANGNLATTGTVVIGRVTGAYANFLGVAHDKILLVESRRA
jgi:hypothetical protein